MSNGLWLFHSLDEIRRLGLVVEKKTITNLRSSDFCYVKSPHNACPFYITEISPAKVCNLTGIKRAPLFKVGQQRMTSARLLTMRTTPRLKNMPVTVLSRFESCHWLQEWDVPLEVCVEGGKGWISYPSLFICICGVHECRRRSSSPWDNAVESLRVEPWSPPHQYAGVAQLVEPLFCNQ